MVLSPEGIEKKRFVVALRGYDKDQVDDFLREVAAAYAEALAGGGRAEAAADPFAALGDRVAAILREAHQTAEVLVAAATKQSQDLRDAAAYDRQAAAAERVRMLREAGELLSRAQQEFDAATELAAEEARRRGA